MFPLKEKDEEIPVMMQQYILRTIIENYISFSIFFCREYFFPFDIKVF